MAQPLAIGIDDFRKIRKENFYYIDKTLMIQDFLTYNLQKRSGKVLCVGISHNKKKCALTYQEITV